MVDVKFSKRGDTLRIVSDKAGILEVKLGSISPDDIVKAFEQHLELVKMGTFVDVYPEVREFAIKHLS